LKLTLIFDWLQRMGTGVIGALALDRRACTSCDTQLAYAASDRHE
jgi:hypothetical protein